MSELKKFLFDNFVVGENKKNKLEPAEEPEVFLQPSEPESSEPVDADFAELPAEEPEVKSYTEEEVADRIKTAEQDAYERGFKTSQEGIDATVSALLENISQKLTALVADTSSAETEREKQSMELVKTIVEKLVPGLSEEHAVEIVNGFISENFKNFKNEAKLSFYIHPDIISYVQENIAKLANSHDFEGKISLHKDASLGKADCRVEWENGGVERNTGRLVEKVEELLADK